MMDNVDLPNDSGNAGKWRIWMPDGSTRMVKGTTNSGKLGNSRLSWQIHGCRASWQRQWFIQYVLW